MRMEELIDWRKHLDEDGVQLHATRNLEDARLHELARAAWRAWQATLPKNAPKDSA